MTGVIDKYGSIQNTQAEVDNTPRSTYLTNWGNHYYTKKNYFKNYFYANAKAVNTLNWSTTSEISNLDQSMLWNQVESYPWWPRGYYNSSTNVVMGVELNTAISKFRIGFSDWSRSKPYKYQGSNDGSTWTDLYSANGDGSNAQTITSDTAYSYIRIIVTGKADDAAIMIGSPWIHVYSDLNAQLL